MKVELTDHQVKTLVEDHISRIDQDEQKRLALLVFQRNNNIDPTVALAAVIKQIAKQHCMTVKHVLQSTGLMK